MLDFSKQDETAVKILNPFSEYLTATEDIYESIHNKPTMGIAVFRLAFHAQDINSVNVTNFHKQLTSLKDKLIKSTASFSSLLEDLIKKTKSAKSVNEAKTILIHKAIQIQIKEEEIYRQIGQNVLQLFHPSEMIMTISNTFSNTKCLDFNIYTCEMHDDQLKLVQHETEITYIKNHTATYMLMKKNISAVIAGTDYIIKNDDDTCQIGTYRLAVLAKTFDIPLFIAAPAFTSSHFDSQRTVHNTPKGGHIPAHLISGIITENGLITDKHEIKRFFI
ncbi:S-methyl-5-thioribose-1-phosphate isomerase [Bacillus sp. WMMC1349]|uniref:S-methyl-5-thioribose-1-phosphate isomerase n=1 Tax=Bacillus sp. WMMC1349 TaxID=2736254 RepID=UPI00155668B2|nr:S-methyl-5-thioribose-1-phosphate isomerase [Bacillus sp. WMMC1349]NPC92315.1 S-methyl-5-thioribose-1-phosphate isomerase [Bacillus sp. WMMC1349]